MKLKYEFNDGTSSEIEVDEVYGNIVVDDRRKEENYERKLRRYHTSSIDSLIYEGSEFADYKSPSYYYEKSLEDIEQSELLEKILKSLTKTEKRRIMLRAEGKTLEEIALLENVSISSVYESIRAARKKAKDIKNKKINKF